MVGAGETRVAILFWEGFRPVTRGKKGIIEGVWLDFWRVESKDVVSNGRGAFQDASKDSSKRTYGKTGGERSCTHSTCNRVKCVRPTTFGTPCYPRIGSWTIGKRLGSNSVCVGHVVGIAIIPIAVPYCFDPPIIFSSFPDSPPRSVAFFPIPSVDLALYDLEHS